MNPQNRYDAAVVGAGILGLAHAYHLARAGLKVVLFERNPRAVGASIRNFGMIWPIGQPPGEMREIALRSREIWLDVLSASGIWHDLCGSMHLAHHQDEVDVLMEFAGRADSLGYKCQFIPPTEAIRRCPVMRKEGIR
jgi:glycine/D-amino acid oxidase-like deaminating enzyme